MSYRVLYVLPALLAIVGGASAYHQRAQAAKSDDAPVNKLLVELQRRFHDTEAVDFGFARLYRPGDRRHRGPIAAQNPKRTERGSVLTATTAMRRPQMTSESQAESEVIDKLVKAKQDVAIYTFGLLGQEKRIPPAEGAQSYFEPGIPRARGPAYLTQGGADGPDAQSLVLLAEQAWKDGRANQVLPGPEGWTLRIQRVVADNKKCVSCHAGEVSKIGEAVGLVVVGTRPAAR